jgi:hypothetical protein
MTDPEERPPVKALFAQLASDTSAFAEAEIAYLREQAGERWSYAVPALIGIGVGIALLLSVAIALPLGLMVALAPITGPFLAILIVALAGLIIGALLARWGSQRLKAALKRPEDRK